MASFYLFMGLSDVFLIAMLVGFFLRRKDPIIQQRGWEFSLCIAFFGLLHFQLMSIEHASVLEGNYLSCHILIWISILFIPMFSLPLLMRSSYAIFRYYSQIEKGKEELGFYTKYRLYASVKFNLLLYLGIAGLVVVIGCIIQFSTPDPVPYDGHVNCLAKQFYLIVVQLVVVVILALTIIIKIWHVQDPYYIKLELKAVMVLCVPLAIVWVAAKIRPFLPPGFNSAFLIMGVIFGGFIACFAIPVAMSLYKGSHLTLLGTRRSSAGSLAPTDFDRLHAILDESDLYERFRDKCQRAWCVENLIFFKKATEFRRGHYKMSPEEREKAAKEIFEVHIKVGATYEVNLDMVTRETLTERIQAENYSDSIFDEASRAVMTLLRFGVYREFSRSPAFLKRFPDAERSSDNLEGLELKEDV